MEKADNVAGSDFQAFVEGVVNTPVRFRHQMDHPVGHAADQFHSVVGRSPVDDDVLHVGPGLAVHRLHTAQNGGGVVEGSCYDGNEHGS